MALTTSYKRGRGPRAASKHSVFNKGMFYGDQLIPEGYAKVLVNYKVNDTGDALYARPGREIAQQVIVDSFDYHSVSKELGEMHLTEYLYQKINEEMELTDTLFSFGKFYDGLNTTVQAYFPDTTVAEIINKPAYYLNYSIEPASAATPVTAKHGWFSYKSGSEMIVKSATEQVGSLTANKISNKGMFGLEGSGDITKPIYTVHNNEIYCFAADNMTIVDSEEADAHVEVGGKVVTEVPFSLSKLVIENDSIVKKPVVVYDPSITEVVGYVDGASNVPGSGYNMLLPNPYVFKHTFNETHKITGGVLMDSIDRATAKPVTSPNIGTTYYYWLYLDVQASPDSETELYKWQIEHRSADNDTWYPYHTINETMHTMPFVLENKRSTGAVDEHKVVYFEYVPDADRFQINIHLQRGDDQTTKMTYASGYIECNNTALQDIKTKNYDLSTAKGMFSWKGIIGIYGVKDAESTVFFSDVDNPGYFPFPNNIEDFGNEVLAVKPANDKLVVVTVDSIYVVTGGPAAVTMIKKQILANTYINPLDAQHIQILKDQVFFKADDQFYVLKPNAKTSDNTDLKNYLNSQPVSPLFKGFKDKILDILNSIYLPTLIDNKMNKIDNVLFENLYSSIVKGKINYTMKLALQTQSALFEKVFLTIVYDPITRVWTLEIQAVNLGTGPQHISITPYTQMDTPLRYMDKETNIYYSVIPFNAAGDAEEEPMLMYRGVHFLQESDTLTTDKFNFNINNASYESGVMLDNYQYIDTGSLALDDVSYKRFRELQFNIYNAAHDNLQFYNTCYVDGVAQVNPVAKSITHITDINDPDYGNIYISDSIDTNISVYGDSELDEWNLDLSSFPDLTLTTIRVSLKGKGRRISIKLLNTSLKKYNISNFTWIYRVMNAR